MIAFGDICWGLRSAGSKINKYQKLPQFVSVPEVFTFVAWKCRFQGSKSEIFWVSKFSKISSNLAISKMKDFGNASYFVNCWMSKCLATNYFWRISDDYMLWKTLKSINNFRCENRIKNRLFNLNLPAKCGTRRRYVEVWKITDLKKYSIRYEGQIFT